MNDQTFGNTPAAAKLVEELNRRGSRRASSKSTRLIVKLCTRLKTFQDSNLPKTEKVWAMCRVHEQFIHSVTETHSQTPLPQNLILCVGAAHFRSYLKKAE